MMGRLEKFIFNEQGEMPATNNKQSVLPSYTGSTLFFVIGCTLVSWLLPNKVLSQSDTTASKKDSIKQMENVTVAGIISSKAIRQQTGNISIVEARPFYNTNATGNDLLRQTSGIKVKQDGGYGSRTSFLINGSTGKQVKFFIDGLPQDNLGETRGLNVFPVEQLERLEVYKGVLPVELGADALGGAINLVTRKERQNYTDVSYAVGSFGTHRFNFLGRKYLSKRFFLAFQGSANTAKNDYKIDVEIPDALGNPKPVTVRRFHDRYTNYNAKLDAGFTSLRWADQVTLSLGNAYTYRHLQHNLLMQQPYGKTTYAEQLYTAVLKWSKAELFKNFSANGFVSYNRVNGLYTDTSQNIYTWDGAIYGRRAFGGEISSSGNRLQLFTNVVAAKLTAAYKLNERHRVVFSNTYQRYNRTGRDTFAQKFYSGIDYFGTPSSLTKNIAGLVLEGSYAGGRLKWSSAVKQYHASIKGYTIDWAALFPIEQTLNATAYNVAVAYKIGEPFLLKASYEHAARLPEAEEAFGDLMLIKPNTSITAERSENINLSLLYNNDSKWDAELSGFYREVDNLIYMRSTLYSGSYQNLLSARVKGVEAAVRYSPTPRLRAHANATYQDLRNQSIIDNSTINNERYKDARIPNVPYLLANGGVSYSTHNIFRKNTALQVWWNTAYTHEYFLYWEVDGARELKNRIPTQLLHYAGLSYSLKDQGLSLSAEAANVFNTTTYDNFKVQLPGRAYSLKLRFYQTKKHHNK